MCSLPPFAGTRISAKWCSFSNISTSQTTHYLVGGAIAYRMNIKHLKPKLEVFAAGVFSRQSHKVVSKRPYRNSLSICDRKANSI
jgi:hypothetical protein